MTIAKGRPWGRQGALEADGSLAASDAALAALVCQEVLAGRVPAPVGLCGGDLHATLGGGTTSRQPSDPDAWHYPVDAMVLRSPHERHGTRDSTAVAVAHVVGFRAPRTGRTSGAQGVLRLRGGGSALRRAPWFVDETLVVANAAFVGDWNIAPRGHPNDGRLEVTRGSLPPRDRRRLAGRLAAGIHLPHPDLATSKPTSLKADPGPWRLFVDGVDTGVVDEFGVELIPDAITVVM